MTADIAIDQDRTLFQEQNKALPDVHSDFWPNPDFNLEISEREGFMGYPRLPLTALRGPHSDHIALALSKHEALSEFSNGVDERAVYDNSDVPWGFEFADWDTELDGKPLAVGFFCKENNAHHVVCMTVEAHPVDRYTEEYEISVPGIIVVSPEGEIFGFVDSDEPLEMRFSPSERTLKLDIIRFYQKAFHCPEQVIERLVYNANAFSEIETYLDPTR